MVLACRVLDLTDVEDGIEASHLEEFHIKEGEFILFKTRNSFREGFDPDFIYLKHEGAKYLAKLGIKGVGIDALGIERSQPDHATHKTLLEQGILILEGLRLKDVPPGEYTLAAAPLKITGVEAAPVRALLIEGKISR
jgi:arylformamidase